MKKLNPKWQMHYLIKQWLNENLVTITSENEKPEQIDNLLFKQKAFGYTYEDIQKYMFQ